ncbi:MAG: bifunctional glutamate N-acetyltransferase/amino-acid acetyltransferase ArgJ [Acidimicrobiia bacterium]|nr:bifunctional glutamate N-acetyltransferase/amino-acid acetyltransferase ArgJ [Acidimicrobiia bacterium]
MADVTSVSPLAPDRFPDLPAVAGVRLATHAAGLRYEGRPDLMLAELAPGTTVAGVFTRSLCPSAPVDHCRRIIGRGTARALVCNAGNANAFTGAAGAASAELTARAMAAGLGVDADDVYLASTGVIGEPMDDVALGAALTNLAPALADADPTAWAAAAEAIRTTDTYAKGSSAPIAGSSASVVGIAKGSGMIAPDMATMLAFVFTDAAVAADVGRRYLSSSVAGSFNRITVDSDTSTSDTVLLFATGQAEGNGGAVDERAFRAALDTVCLDLAHQIVRDGEGATKFVAVTVTGAADDTAAEIIARAIADSPLVKTAFAASDANWGRIVMAVGKSGQAAERDHLAIWIGAEQVAAGGAKLDGYSEARATEHLKGDEIDVRVDVGVGSGSATVWTCDLTHGYIDINAGYRS